jgi:hypothetical protein
MAEKAGSISKTLAKIWKIITAALLGMNRRENFRNEWEE